MSLDVLETAKDTARYTAKMPRTEKRRYLPVVIVAWTALVGTLLTWTIHRASQETHTLAEVRAEAILGRDTAFRVWLASHGGVYVPIGEHTPPNPRLKHLPNRDIVLPSGEKLTLVNPAYAIRQINEQAPNDGETRIRLTSLDPLRPGNAPDPWERRALESLESGAASVSEFTQVDGRPRLRFIQPMTMQESCLKCHDRQSTRPGDIAGGIGISLPLDDLLEWRSQQISGLSLSFGLVWLAGLGVILYGHRRIGYFLRDRVQVEEKFRTAFDASHDAKAIMDTTGVVDCDEAALRMFGYNSRDELRGKHPAAFSTPRQSDGRDSKEKADECIAKAIKDGSHHFEWTGRRVDGDIFTIDILLSRFEMAGNTLLQVTMRDITKAKEATERLRLAAEAASDLIFEWDARHGILDWFGDVVSVGAQNRPVMGA